MRQTKTLVLAAAALAASVTLASAQTAQDHDAHHPGTDAGVTAQAHPQRRFPGWGAARHRAPCRGRPE